MKEFKEYPLCEGEAAKIEIGLRNGIVVCTVNCCDGSGMQVHKTFSCEDYSSLNELIDELLTAACKVRDGQSPDDNYAVHRWYLSPYDGEPKMVMLYPTPSEESEGNK